MGLKPLPHSGYYEIEVKAYASNRFHPYGKELMSAVRKHKYPYEKLFYDSEQPMLLAVGSGSRAGGSSEPPRKLSSVVLDDHYERVYRLHFWANKGEHLYLYFENGPAYSGTKSQFMSWVSHTFYPEIKEMTREERSNLDLRSKRNMKIWDYYEGPEIHISYAESKGPLPFNRELEIHQKLFSTIPAHSKKPDQTLLKKSLTRLIHDLFPNLQDVAITPYLKHINQGLNNKLNYGQALKPVLVAMLCSPEFLYRNREKMSSLQKSMAFIWQSDINVDLKQLKSGQPKSILTHPKHRRMLDSFITQWLSLDHLGTMPPDPKFHQLYYIENLEQAMKQETLMFFHHLYDNNLSVSEIIQADYSFINRGLSYIYDLERLNTTDHVKTQFRPQDNRRGLLTQGSILTLTSNGIESSPVQRGVWVLETLLGSPLSPPPPDVPAIEPDIRGSKTVFKQLEKHRQLKTCATCHDKIDPLGLSLENFDPIGIHRTKYPNGQKVITTSQFRNKPLAGFDDLQQLLEKNIPFMAKNLFRQGMSFALGRPLTWIDETEIESLFQIWQKNGLKFRDMFIIIVGSKLFEQA